MARQQWGTDAGLTLIMTSLGALGALFFRGGMVRKVVTAYSGNSFPSYAPNPIFAQAYQSGEVAVEHWSILTLGQRLEAAARGLPALVTGSVFGSDLAANPAFTVADTPFGPIGLVAPLVPDVALCHAALSDAHGNLAMSEPMLEGTWGAWAARRGVVATVEKIVDDLGELGHRVRIPAHRVLAVVEAPFGAHPGGCYAPGLPVAGYGEDIPFWVDAAAAARGDFDAWARHHLLDPPDHDGYLERLGDDRLAHLRTLADPESWRRDAEANPLPADDPISAWEVAAGLGAREVRAVVSAHRADAVLAGAGVANLAAWVAVGRARADGESVCLTAELGLWDYTPTPADPYIFNHRVFPGTSFPVSYTHLDVYKRQPPGGRGGDRVDRIAPPLGIREAGEPLVPRCDGPAVQSRAMTEAGPGGVGVVVTTRRAHGSPRDRRRPEGARRGHAGGVGGTGHAAADPPGMARRNRGRTGLPGSLHGRGQPGHPRCRGPRPRRFRPGR